MGNGLNIFYIMGFVVGHLFHFMTTLHPVTKNSSFWEAPAQLEKLMPTKADAPTFTAEGGPGDEVCERGGWGWYSCTCARPELAAAEAGPGRRMCVYTRNSKPGSLTPKL
jgi:hypothetical protein